MLSPKNLAADGQLLQSAANFKLHHLSPLACHVNRFGLRYGIVGGHLDRFSPQLLGKVLTQHSFGDGIHKDKILRQETHTLACELLSYFQSSGKADNRLVLASMNPASYQSAKQLFQQMEDWMHAQKVNYLMIHRTLFE